MNIRPEVIPCIVIMTLFFGLAALGLQAWKRPRHRAGLCLAAWFLMMAYLLFFFRDPDRTPPGDDAVLVAGADGRVMAVAEEVESRFLHTNAVRISIFLTLFDVHVNRAPLAGQITYLNYFPGSRYFTFMEKSSSRNQHSAILIEGARTRCLVKQIVGPIARRVVYWLELGQAINRGDRIGMMKFGSRLDMIFPKTDVDVLVKPGDRVKAGETIVARIRPAEENRTRGNSPEPGREMP